jgi:hypothetical protein
MPIRLAFLFLSAVAASSCSLEHARMDLREAPGIDGAVHLDAGASSCPLTPACEDNDYVITLDEIARGHGDSACRTLDFDVHGTDESCGGGALARFAVIRCVGTMTDMRVSVTRVTGLNTVAYGPRGPGTSCECPRATVSDHASVGMLFGSGDTAGVLEYAVSAQDMSFHVEACAF